MDRGVYWHIYGPLYIQIIFGSWALTTFGLSGAHDYFGHFQLVLILAHQRLIVFHAPSRTMELNALERTTCYEGFGISQSRYIIVVLSPLNSHRKTWMLQNEFSINYENVIDCHRIDHIRVAIIDLIFCKSVDGKRATSFRFYIYVEMGAYGTFTKIIPFSYTRKYNKSTYPFLRTYFLHAKG